MLGWLTNLVSLFDRTIKTDVMNSAWLLLKIISYNFKQCTRHYCKCFSNVMANFNIVTFSECTLTFAVLWWLLLATITLVWSPTRSSFISALWTFLLTRSMLFAIKTTNLLIKLGQFGKNIETWRRAQWYFSSSFLISYHLLNARVAWFSRALAGRWYCKDFWIYQQQS